MPRHRLASSSACDRAMIPVLAPLFQHEWVSVGETLALCTPAQWAAWQGPQGEPLIPLRRLTDDPALLDGLLRQHARQSGLRTDDASKAPGTKAQWRAVASDWSLAYLRVLLPTLAASASVLRHVFPASLHDMAMEVDDAGLPWRFFVAHEGSHMGQADTLGRFDALVWSHLAPLFEALTRHTGVPPKILWSNAARRLESIFEEVLALTGHDASVAHDQAYLLDEAQWQGRLNPLHARQRRVWVIEDGLPAVEHLHRACCLCYLLPGQPYCGACPLDPRWRRPSRRHATSAEQAPG